ncbi:transcription factor Dp-2 [Fistulifera solaris]|uniref:Transcription factor Dp-2 n=1 Tax=Fistulifera solaris TaxID=1519565 RepID=A0A1Z5KS24_FISSO|nr:transcription factor Dp-2 [Fistulifera solaris]|eukprot:GAX29124.1 transcription factor Dp-2 [Fistulifera solaris]
MSSSPSRKRPPSPLPPETTTSESSAPILPSPQSVKSSKTVRSGDKGYKGLRHFSLMVCKKVQEKGKTTYNQVADELVIAIKEEHADQQYDEKNIRRRVYDALNVLMAMDIIVKDRKDITWKGLPTSTAQDAEGMRRELAYRQQQIQKKRDALAELLVQQVCFRNLAQHNQKRVESSKPDNKIPLPFIVVNTSSSAVIQCNMSKDLTDVMFDFNMPFEINDDNTILKRLGMHRSTMKDLKEWLPQECLTYCNDHNLLNEILAEEKMRPVKKQRSTI